MSLIEERLKLLLDGFLSRDDGIKQLLENLQTRFDTGLKDVATGLQGLQADLARLTIPEPSVRSGTPNYSRRRCYRDNQWHTVSRSPSSRL